MINWPELATRAAAGPWYPEEFSALEKLTDESSPAARYLTAVIELIKSASFPDCEENERMLVPDMSLAVWGERGSQLNLDSRFLFTNSTLKAAEELAKAAGVTSQGTEDYAVYSACLLFKLSEPMLFAV